MEELRSLAKSCWVVVLLLLLLGVAVDAVVTVDFAAGDTTDDADKEEESLPSPTAPPL